MKNCLIFILAMYYGTLAFADGVTFKRIWLEHNVTQNGEKGLIVHVAFDISGMKGQNCKAIAYFDYPQGTGIKDTNGRYCTTGGTVCTSMDFSPGWTDTSYSDLALFIPNDELHLLSGKRTYYTRVFIQTPSGNFLGNSDFASFDGTGPENNSNHNSYVNNYSSNQYGKLSNVCIYFTNANSTLGLEFDGKWIQQQSLAGYYDQYVVHGTTGKTFFFTFTEPKDDGNFWIFSDGTVSSLKLYMSKDYQYAIIALGGNKIEFTQRTNKETYKRLQDNFYRVDSGSGYSGYSSSNTNNNTSSGGSSRGSRRSCPSCNGTGKGTDQITWQPNYTGTDNSTYCSQCGSVKPAHSHRAPMCRTCNGRGYVE